jgi:hypothetical protein
VVNKRMKPAKVLQLVNRAARKARLTVDLVPSRGKGSHGIYVVRDEKGTEVVRFAVTGHKRELSWTVLWSIEDALAPLFGEKWMEER